MNKLKYLLLVVAVAVTFCTSAHAQWRAGTLSYESFMDQTYTGGTPAGGTGRFYVDGKDAFFIDSDGVATSMIGAVSGITDVVSDLTPQLGGDLDMNSKNFDFPTTANISDVLDEDNMVSNSATKLATQQSIKAYVDTQGAGDNVLIDGTNVTDGSGVDLQGGTDVTITFNAGVSPDTASFAVDSNKDIVATSPLTVNAGANLDDVIVGSDADITIAIADADDDGTTKGAASFDNTDFNATSGNVTIVDDGHAHTTTSLSGIVNADLSGSAGVTSANIADGTIDADAMGADSVGESELIESMGFTPTGAWNFGGATDLEIPNSATPTVDTAGQIAVDTNGMAATHGSLEFHDGTQLLHGVGTTDTPGNNEIPKYDSGTGKVTWEADVAGSAPATADITDVSVTQTEFAELETIGDNTISANQWAALGSIAETTTGEEINYLDGIAAQKRRVYIGAASGWPATTSGCAAAVQSETTTNKVNYYACAFDGTTDEKWQASFTLPESYNGGTFTAAVEWSGIHTAADTVRWDISIMSIGDDDVLDTAFGTKQSIDDDTTATGDFQRTAETSAITASGSPAGGDRIWILVNRDATTDDDTDDAKFMGIWLVYGVDQFSTED